MTNSADPPSSSTGEIVLDHRSLPRYLGDVPEPRPGIPSGHIPNSLPLAFTQYLRPADDNKPYSSYKAPKELKQVLVDGVGGSETWAAIEEGKKGVVFSCGSGMTAAVGWVANELVKEAGQGGAEKSSIYDEVSGAELSGSGGVLMVRAGRDTRRGKRARSLKARRAS